MRLDYLALAPLWLWPWASFATSAAATDARCAFHPFGRPKASDCVYIVNHIMPEGNDPIGLVLRDYPKYPYMTIPIFWFYKTCIVFLMSDDVTPLNIHYTWWASMNQIIKPVDSIIDKCMVRGESSWPPHSGGIVRRFGDALHGPLQISTYGVPEYRKLYDAAGVLDGGVLSGHSPEAEVFMSYIGSKGRPETSRQTQPSIWNPLLRQSCKHPCSTHQDCSAEGDFLCVAISPSAEDTQLFSTCCRSSGSRVLKNSSLPSNNRLVRPSTTSPLPFPISKFGCACNCTYVSQACCGVETGLVSEQASLRLGAVQSPNSTVCCESGSGTFSQRSPRDNSTYC